MKKVFGSIIISALESYSVVARQILYFDRILPDDWELIIMDDGSDPSIRNQIESAYEKAAAVLRSRANLRLIETNFMRIPWHQPQARNEGAKIARGRYLFFTDIDHIITAEAIDSVIHIWGANQNSNIKKIVFPRTWGILDEDGSICIDTEILKRYGLQDALIGRIDYHYNTFAMPIDIFQQCPYREYFQGFYGGDDVQQTEDYEKLAQEKGWRKTKGAMIYVYPDPRRDVMKIFHSLREEGACRETNCGNRIDQ